MGERRVELEADVLVVREAGVDDVEGLRKLFEELPLEDEYSRFFSAFRPDTKFLTRMATANENGACQLLALVQHGDGRDDEVVGEAGAWPLPNGNGELAITVARGHRGWLGPFLLDAVAESAAARGIPNLEADVLFTNSRMLALLRARGYAVAGHDGFTSARLIVSTSGSVPTWPPGDKRPHVLVESPGSRWAGEAGAAEAGLHVLICPGPSARPRGRCPALEGEPCPLAQEADAIVFHLDGDRDATLLDAHAALHHGVPVCIDPLGTAGSASTLQDVLRVVGRSR